MKAWTWSILKHTHRFTDTSKSSEYISTFNPPHVNALDHEDHIKQAKAKMLLLFYVLFIFFWYRKTRCTARVTYTRICKSKWSTPGVSRSTSTNPFDICFVHLALAQLTTFVYAHILYWYYCCIRSFGLFSFSEHRTGYFRSIICFTYTKMCMQRVPIAKITYCWPQIVSWNLSIISKKTVDYIRAMDISNQGLDSSIL